jgi:CRP-like cAMP-binding protein
VDNSDQIADTRCVAEHPVRNRILLRIPEEEFVALAPHLQLQKLNNAAQLVRRTQPIRAVYFVNRGIVSTIVELADGRSVEVALSGPEDLIGLTLASGLPAVNYTQIAQSPAEVFRLDGETMMRLLPSLPELSRHLHRLLAVRFSLVAQNGACNRLHKVQQRLAKWILVSRDRLESDELSATQDFLSTMVGTDRPTVTVALIDFEQKGILSRSRGSLTIVDGEALEAEACECYQVYKLFNAELGLDHAKYADN